MNGFVTLSRVDGPFGSFLYYPTDCIGNWIKAGNFWDVCHKPYMDELQPGDVFVDIGANIGFYPVYLGRRGVRVHAFEASPEIMEVMRRNVFELNGLSPDLITLYQVALYDRETELALEYKGKQYPIAMDGRVEWEHAPNAGTFCLVPPEHGLPLKAYNFQTKTVDSFGLENIKMMKVDVQGCDLRVLKGARETIRKSMPLIFFEYESGLSIYHDDMYCGYEQFFQEMGYQKPKDLGRGVEWVTAPANYPRPL